jgi:hypothetical protein
MSAKNKKKSECYIDGQKTNIKYATSWKAVGSRPDEVNERFNSPNRLGRTSPCPCGSLSL